MFVHTVQYTALHVIISFSTSFSLLSFCYFIPRQVAKKLCKKRREIGQKERTVHELPYTEMVKSETIIDSPQVKSDSVIMDNGHCSGTLYIVQRPSVVLCTTCILAPLSGRFVVRLWQRAVCSAEVLF